MSDIEVPPIQEDRGNGGPGEPATGWAPHATNPGPPFAETSWRPPSRFAKFLVRGATLTITMTPTALFVWLFMPDELKYELRKQVRWLPWAARYAAWWLRQEGW